MPQPLGTDGLLDSFDNTGQFRLKTFLLEHVADDDDIRPGSGDFRGRFWGCDPTPHDEETRVVLANCAYDLRRNDLIRSAAGLQIQAPHPQVMSGHSVHHSD